MAIFQHKNQAPHFFNSLGMGSKHSRPSEGDGSPRASRPHDNQSEAEISAEARAEFTVADIRSPEGTKRAQTLWKSENDRFCKYRNYFKNHHMSLAREVGRKTSKGKAELLKWVEDAVGPLEGGDKLTKVEILEIAMVSAALTEYGEKTLAKMYDRGELDALPNIPLHTHNLRMPGKQQQCRDNSDAANKDKLEAAHYVGLEVMLRLNERLPVEQRMGEELREILNHPSNLRLMSAKSNQVLHKKVDAMLINASDTKSTQPRKQEYDRLVQIAKHAQDESFQDAMAKANGHYLYRSLRDQFNRLDVGDRPRLWDVEKDKREMQQPPRTRYRSPSPAREPPRAPHAPPKKEDPEPRLVPATDSEKKHRNPFSRLTAKIFRSHHKKKQAAARPTSTATDPADTNDKKSKPPAKKSTTRPAAHSRQTKSSKLKGKTKAAAKKPTHYSNQNSEFVDDGSADDDSDYVDADSDEEYVDADSDENVESKDRTLHVGPRGGEYFVNAAGKKVYVK